MFAMMQRVLWLSACVLLSSCKTGFFKPQPDSDVKGFFATESINEKFVLHTKSLSEDSVVEYIKRFRMANKDEDPKMPDKELAKKILMIADLVGIDPYILTVIPRKESEYIQSATGPGGSAGLMQILPPTIAELNTQLGKEGPDNARATTIKYLQDLWKDMFPKVVGKPFDGKPWATNQMTVIKNDPYQNLIYGATILKVYLALSKSQNKKGAMKDWYVKGLEMYNGSGKKAEYRQIVMNWADDLETEYGGASSVSSKVAEEPGITIDQAQTDKVTFVGTWPTVNASLAQDGNYRHDDNSSKGRKTATFRPGLESGIYRTYGRWVNHVNKSATNVPVMIAHANGTSNVKVNQRENSGQWTYMGTFTFDKEQSNIGIINSGTDGFVVADAFKFIKEAVDPLIIVDTHDRDERRIVMEGTWDYKDDTEEVAQAYNRSLYLANPTNGVSKATFKPNTKGKYKVATLWLNGDDHSSKVTYSVKHAAGSENKVFNQKTGGGNWVDIGTYDLDLNSSIVITTEGSDGIVIADAIRFDLVQ